jgi:hypothetical protein
MSSGTEYALRLVEVEKERNEAREKAAGRERQLSKAWRDLAAAEAGWKLATADLASETKRANAAEARAEAAEGALRRVEWLNEDTGTAHGTVSGYDYCPSCNACRGDGHFDGCSTRAVLPASPPPDAKTRTEPCLSG